MVVILVVISLCFLGILVRVGMLQTTQAKAYQAYAVRQRARNETLPAPRGQLLDRSGRPLAMSVPSKSIYADPRAIVDAGKTVVTLARLLGFSAKRQKALLAQLSVPNTSFVYVAREVEAETALVIENLKLPGIGSIDETRRYLPNGDVGRGVIGGADVDGRGSSGLEKQYDKLLTGVDGQLRQIRGTKGRSIPSSHKALIEPIPGNDVQLTLDLSLQYQAEQALAAKVSELGARGGSAIVLDSRTGEVLAMASVRRDAASNEVRVGSANYAAVDSYEPGSVAKVVTVAAALNEKKVTASTTFVVPYRKKYWDEWLHDAEAHPTMPFTVGEILAKSSNIGTIFVSESIGPDKQESYMRAFGLGEPTALDFPGEARGILHPNSKWRGTENVTVAYGQGVAATAIQLVSAVNVIANGGVYVAPKLVKAVVSPEGKRTVTMPSATRRVVSAEVASQMNFLMRDVVCSGTAKGWAGIKGYTIAGKTGTGYKAQRNGTYFDEQGRHAYYASFVGFLPAENPRITVLVSIDEPPPGAQHFGANTAAPVFNKIARAAIVELGIQAPSNTAGCANAKAVKP
jgi:cell division protein FtsI (penicillin-binding protein 3)